MNSTDLAWREYLRNIGGRKNLRPGEEAAVKQAIRTSLVVGGSRERRHALECIEDYNKRNGKTPEASAIYNAIIGQSVTGVVGVQEEVPKKTRAR